MWPNLTTAQILCSKWPAHVRECRGIIVCRFRDRWEVLSRPFDKFFNQFEGVRHPFVTA